MGGVEGAGANPAAEPTGAGPFRWFGVALLVGVAWALAMGLAYASTPTFVVDDLPTIAGVVIAVVALLVIVARAPPNE